MTILVGVGLTATQQRVYLYHLLLMDNMECSRVPRHEYIHLSAGAAVQNTVSRVIHICLLLVDNLRTASSHVLLLP